VNNDVQSYVSDIRMKLGNVGERDLPLHILLSRLYSVINKRIVELNISTQNWVLRWYEFSFNGSDTYPLSGIEDFGNPILVEIADVSGGTYIPIETVNRTNVRLAMEANKAAAAFDVIDEQPMIHFTIPAYLGVARIWYEPDTPQPRNLSANVPLKRLFRDYITTEVSLLCLPYVNYSQQTPGEAMAFKSSLRDSFVAEIEGLPPDYEGGWREAWMNAITRAKIQGRASRIPFRAGV
jgi:hypothetical protein